MKRLVFVMMVMAVLEGISTNAMASTARARSRERFRDSYFDYRARSRENFPDSYVFYAGGYYDYGYGYGYGPVYDRYEYTHTAPGYKHHVYDRRSGGVITGIGEFLFGKRELDINIEEGYPSSPP